MDSLSGSGILKGRFVHIGWRTLIASVASAFVAAASASGQLFIYPPDFSGPPVTGTEPGLFLPLPNATPGELTASKVWSLRAGLNVAALQCQFSPTLGTVRNYNQLLRHQSSELDKARISLEGYFKRTIKPLAQAMRSFDQYTTRTYNNYSTFHGQLGFCQTAGQIGRAALGTPKGGLHELATLRLRELRNSMTPVGDRLFGIRNIRLDVPQLTDPCLDKKGRRKKKC